MFTLGIVMLLFYNIKFTLIFRLVMEYNLFWKMKKKQLIEKRWEQKRGKQQEVQTHYNPKDITTKSSIGKDE